MLGGVGGGGRSRRDDGDRDRGWWSQGVGCGEGHGAVDLDSDLGVEEDGVVVAGDGAFGFVGGAEGDAGEALAARCGGVEGHFAGFDGAGVLEVGVEVGLGGCWAEVLDEDCSSGRGPEVAVALRVRGVEGDWGGRVAVRVAVGGFMGCSVVGEVLEGGHGGDGVWWVDGEGERITEGGRGRDPRHVLR